MQQFITSSEACALLDRILQTVQSLSQAIIDIDRRTAPLVLESALPPVIVGEPSVPPPDERPIAPALTIKLSDLIREGMAARERRQRRPHPLKPRHSPPEATPIQLHARKRSKRPLRPTRDVEVVYRKNYRLVS